jgi:hypothetical protein
MAILTINGTDHEAKCNFKFDRLAEERYNEADKDGNKMGGFMSIYMNLLQFDPTALSAFWDCALSHLGKGKPGQEDIENALMEQIDKEGDTEGLIKEAFGVIDNSGFFKKQAKNFWKDLEMLKDSGKTKEEKADNLMMYNRLHEAKKEIVAE